MITLDVIEARVVGALLEKETTTPDQYPLSLNGLTTACNQKSNREPVMQLREDEVLDAVERLKDQNLVAEVVFGSRVAKYKHRFCNNEFSVLKLNKREVAILGVLLLRGPQTPGELRSRTARLCDFSDVSEVEQCLQTLIQRETGPLVALLSREPGRREARYRQLFTEDTGTEGGSSEHGGAAMSHSAPSVGTVSDASTSQSATSALVTPQNTAPSPSGHTSQEARIAAQESELATLRADFDALKAQWDAFNA